MSEMKGATKLSRNAKRIFFMVLLAILADQTVETVIVETIAPIKVSYGSITNTYLLSTMPFALLLASWSDFHCRRKTMIFSTICLLISAIFITVFIDYNSNWIVYTALAFKGIGGNVTPVALASLATIVSRRHFTICLAIAICAYSVGIWVPIYFHSFDHLHLTASILALLSVIIIFIWFRESEFDNFKFQRNTANLRKFFTFLRKDIFSIIAFGASASVLLAMFGFIASEISYYQILLRGEVLHFNKFYTQIPLIMGYEYYFGTLILYFLLKNKLSDSKCLITGVLLSLVAIFSTAVLGSMGIENMVIFHSLFGFYVIGFALLTPCLFSILSKISHIDEQGKIYGFLDSFDTLSSYVVVKYILSTKTIEFTNVLWFSTILIFISMIFVVAFVRDVKDREINLS